MTTPPPPTPLPQGEQSLYMLRVWHEYDGERPVWRASLRPHHDAQRRYFTSPEALLRYLGECLGAPG